MSEKIKKLLLAVVVVVATYIFVPLLSEIIASEASFAILVMFLLILYPLLALVVSLVYSVKYGFNFVLPLSIAGFFIPMVFIFFNESALIYSLIYGAASLVGSLIGHFFYKEKQRN